MIEARIECVCVEYTLDDLGAILRKGDVRWFTEAQARASADLRIAERAGGVMVRWEERCTVARPPLPNFVKRPNRKARSATPVLTVRPSASPAQGQADLAKLVGDSVRGVVQDEIAKVLANHVGKPLDQAEITAAVRAAVGPGGAVSKAVAALPVSAVDDTPMFIPSGLVPTNVTTAISVESETNVSGGLDDAAEALRVVRRSKKKEQ